MTSASEHVLPFLASKKNFAGDSLMLALFNEDSQYENIQARAKIVWELLGDSERYNTNAIEAFFVLKYKQAHLFWESLVSRLEEDTMTHRYYEENTLYRSALTGLLGAAVWADKNSVQNHAFSKILPELLATLLATAVREMLVSENTRTSDLEEPGRFTRALTDYVSAKYCQPGSTGRTFRCKGILAGLGKQDFDALPACGEQFMVTNTLHAILNALTSNQQIELLLSHFSRRTAPTKDEPRLRTYATVTNGLFRFSLGGELVFASKEDAQSYFDFVHLFLKDKADEGGNRNSFCRQHMELECVARIPKRRADHEPSILTEFTQEYVDALDDFAHELFEDKGVPSEQQHLPVVGQRHGAITFEWTPPTLEAVIVTEAS